MVYGTHMLTCRTCGAQAVGTDFIDLNWVCPDCVTNLTGIQFEPGHSQKRKCLECPEIGINVNDGWVCPACEYGSCQAKPPKKKPRRMIQTGRTLEDYGRVVVGKKCKWCDEPLPTTVDHYDHEDGWPVEGFENKQWLSVHCYQCDYDWSLAKLGVPR